MNFYFISSIATHYFKYGYVSFLFLQILYTVAISCLFIKLPWSGNLLPFFLKEYVQCEKNLFTGTFFIQGKT